MKQILLLCVIVVLAGCSGYSVSAVSRTASPVPAGQIGMAPGGGELADAISVELFQRGFDVVESTKIQQLEITDNNAEINILRPDNLQKLGEQGIKTILMVKSIPGYDGKPQSATVRIVRTDTGQMIAAVNWQNGYGGRFFSLADRVMRSDTQDAAREIADQLSKKLTQ